MRGGTWPARLLKVARLPCWTCSGGWMPSDWPARRSASAAAAPAGSCAGRRRLVSRAARGAKIVVRGATAAICMGGHDLRQGIEDALGKRYDLRWSVVGSGPDVHADERTVSAATAAVTGADCAVTVGSGTVTDIGKAAARADGNHGPAMPLICVQTATSVNGFADPFSVLLRDGVKRTTPSRWPDVLIADTEVLASAPPDLNRAGVGDMMAMFTASADWYLASVLGRPALESAGDPGGDPAWRAGIARLT